MAHFTTEFQTKMNMLCNIVYLSMEKSRMRLTKLKILLNTYANGSFCWQNFAIVVEKKIKIMEGSERERNIYNLRKKRNRNKCRSKT